MKSSKLKKFVYLALCFLIHFVTAQDNDEVDLSVSVVQLNSNIILELCSIEGCSCMKTTIWCQNIKTKGYQLKTNKNLSYSLIEDFTIKNNNFNSIPEDSFREFKLNSLSLIDNGLVKIETKSFHGINQINKLIIRDKSLKIIEHDAFVPLGSLLSELEVSFSDLSNNLMNEFFKEIIKLQQLQTILLNDNNLDKVEPKWFNGLQNLILINLSNNRIKSISPHALANLPDLKFINLKNNYLSGCLDQTPFLPLKQTLVRINFSYNRLICLPEFDMFEKLRYLDISNNKIEIIKKNTFLNLNKLYILNLNHNRLYKIHTEAFSKLKDLFYLKLENNRLDRMPNIKKMISLIELSVKNQNGNLNTLNDYQFERESKPILSLTVNLEDNNFKYIGNKAFCTSNYKEGPFDLISLSARTFKNIIDTNKCILAQLVHSNSSFTIKLNPNDINEDIPLESIEGEICTCDMINFLKSIRVGLSGIDCSEFILSNKCDLNESVRRSYLSECSSLSEVSCNDELERMDFNENKFNSNSAHSISSGKHSILFFVVLCVLNVLLLKSLYI